MRKLEASNEQLVTLAVEQRHEIRSTRDDVTAFSKRPYAEVARFKPPGSTLVVGNNLLKDVKPNTSTDGVNIKIRKKSGATFKDIGDMIDDAYRTGNEDINRIVIVGGTRQTMDKVSTDVLKEGLEQLLH